MWCSIYLYSYAFENRRLETQAYAAQIENELFNPIKPIMQFDDLKLAENPVLYSLLHILSCLIIIYIVYF